MHELVFNSNSPDQRPEIITAIPKWYHQRIALWKEELPDHTVEITERGALVHTASWSGHKAGSEKRKMVVGGDSTKLLLTQSRRNQFFTFPPQDTARSAVQAALRGKQTNVSTEDWPEDSRRNPATSLIETTLSLGLEPWISNVRKGTTHNWKESTGKSDVAVLEQVVSFGEQYCSTKYTLTLSDLTHDPLHSLRFEVFSEYDPKTLRLMECKIEALHLLPSERAKCVYILYPRPADLAAGFVDAECVTDQTSGSFPSGNKIPTEFEHKYGMLSASAELTYPGIHASVHIDVQLRYTAHQILSLNDSHLDPKVTLTCDSSDGVPSAE